MDRRNLTWGIILVAAGLVWALDELRVLPGSGFLLIVAIGFLAAYFVYRRSMGFLIPGCIIGAVGAYSIFQDIFRHISSDFFLLFLGIAFIAVFIVHTSNINDGSWGSKFWPLIPGGILAAVGTLGAAGSIDLIGRNMDLIIPVIFVVIGVSIIAKGFRRQ